MPVPRHLLRLLFSASAFCCALILVLFLRSRAPQDMLGWWGVAGGAAVIAAVASALAFRRGGLLLGPVGWGALLRGLVLHGLLAYTGTAALLTLAGWGLLSRLALPAVSSLALAAMSGLWLALWIAPGVVACTLARRLGPPAA